MKKCSKCGKIKDALDFPDDKSHKDGKRSQCNVCHAEATKKYREENKQAVKASKKKYADRQIHFNDEEMSLLTLIMKETHEMAMLNNTDGLDIYASIVMKLRKAT